MKRAFTLPEVLLTLVIIGIIAALTIPALYSKIEEHILINRLKETYSMLTKAYELAKVDNGAFDTWNIGPSSATDSSTKAYNYLKPYLKVSKDCGRATNKDCFANHYKALFNDNLNFQPNQTNFLHKVLLKNGVALCFQNSDSNIGIFVDVNGKKGPNRGGVDFHRFKISNKGLIPGDGMLKPNQWNICKYKDNNFRSLDCAAWAIEMGNMDYLRRDVTEDWKKHKGIK